MILLTDSQDNVIETSPMLTDALGLQRSEIVGKNALEMLSEGTEVAGGSGSYQAMLATRDGSGLPVRFSGRTLDATDERSERRLYIFHDVSDVVDVEERLMAKAQEAEEASDAKSRFLAAMSHELRTPMNAIMGFAQLLKLSKLDRTLQSHVDAIIASGGDLMELLSDLLDLSEIESGRLRLENERFNLREMLDETAANWRPGALAKELELRLDLTDDTPDWILSDRTRIQQVLNNFLSNAIRFTESGLVELSARAVSAESGTLLVRFEVTDSGKGISEPDLARLFRPFVQIGSDFKKERGGWGLGLSVCRNIADVMGAEIGAESKLGEGSTFFLILPVEAG
jgi:signal transduction histidine kinase